MNDLPLLVYFGHHKCASTWIIQILQSVAAHTNLAHLRWDDLHSRSNFSGSLLCYGNSSQTNIHKLPPFRGFHVIRDPRDLLVSAYFSHRYSHPLFTPTYVDRRSQLELVDQSTGLMLEFDFCAEYLQQIASWDYHQPNVLELRFEELTRDPLAQFTHVFEFLGLLTHDSPPNTQIDRLRSTALLRYIQWIRRLQIPANLSAEARQRKPRYVRASLRLKRFLYHRLRALIGFQPLYAETLRSILQKHSFENKSGGRQPGAEDQRHHYRKGVPGDWRNYFEPIHIAEFKRRYNDMLLALGYESDPDWR